MIDRLDRRPAVTAPDRTPRLFTPIEQTADRPIEPIGVAQLAELLPELIEHDDLGYPIVRGGAVPPDLVALARRAVDACPVLALRLRALT